MFGDLGPPNRTSCSLKHPRAHPMVRMAPPAVPSLELNLKMILLSIPVLLVRLTLREELVALSSLASLFSTVAGALSVGGTTSFLEEIFSSGYRSSYLDTYPL